MPCQQEPPPSFLQDPMNNLNKKYFIGSFLAHLFLFLFIFYMAIDNNINKRFVVFGMHSKKSTHAYFREIKTPTTTSSQWLQQRNIQQKKAETSFAKASTVAKAMADRSAVSKAEKPLIKKTEQKKVSKPTPKKQPLKKALPKTKQTTIKKDVQKKIAEPKKITPVEKKLEKDETKIDEQIKETKKTEIAEESAVAKAMADKMADREELHFNLMGESDPNLIKYQLSIQKEVERLWHPPVGVPKGTECSICFNINSNGTINKFEFIKRSKILIYDLSVSKIAKNFQFDRSLWNKKFTIDFRQ